MRHELARVIYAARPTQAGMINQSVRFFGKKLMEAKGAAWVSASL